MFTPKDIFTEEQLPRGTVLVVGRTQDGQETATVLDRDRPELWGQTIRFLIAYMDKPDSGCRDALQGVNNRTQL